MTELHQQLRDTLTELEQIRKVKVHVKELRVRLEAEEEALHVMDKVLEKEQKDVETLEKEGLTSMFRKFLGDREQQLDKEREEYLRASLRYNELFKSVGLIRYELDLLTEKENNEEVVIRRMEVQLKMREEEIMQLDPKVAIELRALHDQADQLHQFEVEVEEALRAGMDAFNLVNRAEYFLKEAHGWGQRDMWSGRDRSSGHLKKQSIDQARDLISQARHILIRFSTELKDVFRNLKHEFTLDGIETFTQFGEIFFNNLITDYLVREKINKSLTNVSTTRQQVEYFVRALEDEKRIAGQKAEQLEKQRKEIILKSEA